MIDHDARERVRQAVDDYLSEVIGSFEFDDRLFAVDTSDATANFVVDVLWSTYDDIEDHCVCLHQDGWNTVQRLVLLLESNAEIHTFVRRAFHASQIVAAAEIASIAVVAFANWRLWPLAVLPAGLVSMLVSRWRSRAADGLSQADPWHAWPFQSLAVLRECVHGAPHFHKRRYRAEIGDRRVRTLSSERAMTLQFWFTWCLCSPVALLFQCMPIKATQITVSTGEASRLNVA